MGVGETGIQGEEERGAVEELTLSSIPPPHHMCMEV